MNPPHSFPRLTLATIVFCLPLSALADLGPGKLIARQLITGLSRPVYVTSPPGDSERLFIVERHHSTNSAGRIQIHDRKSGAFISTFLTLNNINTGGEEGLLGLAFHPSYANNGHFYVYFSDGGGGASRRSFVRRYTANGPDFVTATTSDPTSAHEVLSFFQPQGNHNGGWIGFNPAAAGDEKYHLYISVGDGGSSGDNDEGHPTPGNNPLPFQSGNAQDKTVNFLGKILRIDTGSDGTADAFPGDANSNYAIPANNPFIGSGATNGLDEIWAFGLRNPWRCSFDSQSGDLWIADVGQGLREEVNFQPATSLGGENYGWRLREGFAQTPNNGGNPTAIGGAKPAGNVDPVIDYPRNNTIGNATTNGGVMKGNSITGGCVYRGRMAWLRSTYFFSDYQSNRFWSMHHDGNSVTETTEWTNDASIFTIDSTFASFTNFASISEGGDGEIYICTQPQNSASQTDGTVFVLTQKPFFLFRSTYFTEPQLNDDAVSGPDADFDKDGLTTVEEFFFNTNPIIPDAPKTAASIEGLLGGGGTPGETFLTLTLEISEEAKAAAIYDGRSGGGLGNLLSTSAVSAFDPPGSTTLKVQDTVPVTSSTRRFLQIEAILPSSELTE